jgi:hypothetical protein
MLRRLYKSIVSKFELAPTQLAELLSVLTPERVSVGEFMELGKRSPILLIFLRLEELPEGASKPEIRALLKKYYVDWLDRALFYLLFDLPIKMKPVYLNSALEQLRQGVSELMPPVNK